MRFFRIARILNIPDILQFLHILRSSNSIRLTRMLCLLFTVWLSAAGFVHLVNSSMYLLVILSLYYHFHRWRIPEISFRIIPIHNQLLTSNVCIS